VLNSVGSTHILGNATCPAGRVRPTLPTSFLQEWANGGENRGLVLGAGGKKRFRSGNYGGLKPEFKVPYNSYPETVALSSPADGSTADTVTPTLNGRFSDPDGGTGHVKYQVFRADDLSTPPQ